MKKLCSILLLITLLSCQVCGTGEMTNRVPSSYYTKLCDFIFSIKEQYNIKIEQDNEIIDNSGRLDTSKEIRLSINNEAGEAVLYPSNNQIYFVNDNILSNKSDCSQN